MSGPWSRRELLRHVACGAGVWMLGPGRRERASAEGPVLVLLQLSGGNDGLNTVVPLGSRAYTAARPGLGLDEKRLLLADDRHGLHPDLGGFAQLLADGRLAIVNGVGYPRSDRSHFKAMDAWHAADPRGRHLGSGWIGRLVDVAFRDVGDPNLVVHVGSRLPYSLRGSIHAPIAFATPQAYRWIGAPDEVRALRDAAPICESGAQRAAAPPGPHLGRDAALARLRRVLHAAQASSDQVRAAVAAYRPRVPWPRTGLAARLSTVAALLSGGVGTRVFSVELAGFDTHVGQLRRHAPLLRELGDAVRAFVAELVARRLDGRVLGLAFSEFGRRVRQNGSGGTDHGAAGPAFLFGSGVQPGLHGRYPSLTALDAGDLVPTTDFRSVYAEVIDRWVGAAHAEILGRRWKLPGVLKAPFSRPK